MKKKESNRLQVFKALKRAGLGGTELRDRVGMAVNSGQMGIILRGEMKAGRIVRKEILSEKASGNGLEPSTSTVYTLTAMGRKHLEEGIVDSWARERGLIALGTLPTKETDDDSD